MEASTCHEARPDACTSDTSPSMAPENARIWEKVVAPMMMNRMVQAIEMNLSLNTYHDGDWRPPVLKTVATTGDGIEAVWQSISAFSSAAEQTRGAARRAGAAAW